MSNSNKYAAHNTTEDLVEMHLDTCIQKAGACNCKRCREDIRAFALNNLPPHYVVSKVGETYVRLNSLSTQNQADIFKAIMDGINLVSKNPYHEE